MRPEYSLIVLMFVLVAYLAALLIKRRSALFVIAIMWLLFPNWGTNLFGVDGVPLFAFVEIFGAAVLAIYIFLDREQSAVYRSREKQIIILFFLTFFVQYLFSSFLVEIIFGRPATVPDYAYITSFSVEVSSLIFLLGCYKFIRTIEDAEKMLLIFVIAGIVLAAEYLLVRSVPFLDSLVGRYMANPQGRFNSIFLNDYDAVGIVSSVGAVSALYFYKTRGKFFYLLAMPVCAAVPFLNFTRSTILALGCALLFYFYKAIFKHRMIATAFIAMGLFLLYVYLDFIVPVYLDLLPTEFLHAKVMGAASTDSIFTRWGTQLRALEIMIHIFPLGLGNDMLRYYFSMNAPPLFPITSPMLMEGYSRVASGLVLTESHNIYVEFAASYGLLGIVSMVTFIVAVFYNAMATRVRRATQSVEYHLYILLYSLIIFFAVFHMFVARPKVYIVFFFLFHLTFLLRERYKGASGAVD